MMCPGSVLLLWEQVHELVPLGSFVTCSGQVLVTPGTRAGVP